MTTNPVELTARPLVTAGRVQLLVDCPRCHGVHRHLALGVRRGPCGYRYAIVDDARGPEAAKPPLEAAP